MRMTISWPTRADFDAALALAREGLIETELGGSDELDDALVEVCQATPGTIKQDRAAGRALRAWSAGRVE